VPEENKTLARRFLEARARGEMYTLDELLSLDFVDRSLPPGQKPGREDYKRSLADTLSVFSDAGLEIEDRIAEGDMVVSRFMGSGVHRGEFLGIEPTGRETSYSGIHVLRISDSKIAEERSEPDSLEVVQRALEQDAEAQAHRARKMATLGKLSAGSPRVEQPGHGGKARRGDCAR
jgi:predicted ester cyclase